MPNFIRVCPLDEIPAGQVRLKEVDGTKIALCNVDGRVFALSNFCPHMTGNLGEGRIEDGLLVCPEHFWRFQPSTGRCVSMPDRAAHAFPVQVDEGWILVGL